jgi:hypothetical protein
VVQEIGVDIGSAPSLVTPALLGGADPVAAAYGHPAVQDHGDHGILETVLQVGEELRMLP